MSEKVVIPVMSGDASATEPAVAVASPQNPEPVPPTEAQGEAVKIAELWRRLFGLNRSVEEIQRHVASLRAWESRPTRAIRVAPANLSLVI